MNCPKCKAPAMVKDTRNNVGCDQRYRQQKCTKCGNVFYTCEKVVEYDTHFHYVWGLSERRKLKRREE